MPQKDYLIIDGYNVINAWNELICLKDISFEHARSKLIDIIINYAHFKNYKAIIVFDAHQVKGGNEHREYHSGVEVIFSRENITADMVIERLIGPLVKNNRVFVVTSDKTEQDLIWSMGALRISARELELEIGETSKENKVYNNDKKSRRYRLDAHLNDELRYLFEKWRRGK